MCSLLSLYTNYSFLVIFLIHHNKLITKLFVLLCYFLLLLVDMHHCFYHTEAIDCTEETEHVVHSSSKFTLLIACSRSSWKKSSEQHINLQRIVSGIIVPAKASQDWLVDVLELLLLKITIWNVYPISHGKVIMLIIS